MCGSVLIEFNLPYRARGAPRVRSGEGATDVPFAAGCPGRLDSPRGEASIASAWLRGGRTRLRSFRLHPLRELQPDGNRLWIRRYPRA
jgi:hypothetical protein